MKNLRYITDAAMTSALVLVILLISHYTGAEIEEMFPFFVSVPVAIYTMHYGWKKGLIPSIAISALALLHNPLHAIFFVVTSNIVGLIYGTSLYKEYSNSIKITIAVTGSFVVNILSIWIFSKLLYGYTIYEEMQNTINSLFSNINVVSERLKLVIYAISEGLIPSIILILSILEGFVFHIITTLLSVRVFKKKQDVALSILKFYMPHFITIPYVIILALVICFTFKVLELEGFLKYLWIVGINITTVGALFYIFVAILFFLKLSHFKNNRLIYIFACLFSVVLFPFYLVFGIVDSFFKFGDKFKNK